MPIMYDDATAVDPPTPLLPVLSLDEAHDVLDVLAAVVNGGRPDVEAAGVLLSNLAARLPSRAESSFGAAEAELLEAAAPFGPRQVSDAVYTALYELGRAISVGNAAVLRGSRDRVARIDGARIRLPDSQAGRHLRAALTAYAAAWAAADTSASREV